MNPSPPSPPAVASDTRQSFKVFVSSTFLDNQERRRLVQDAITMAAMVWLGMEIFTASTRPTVEECLRHASEADLLVGIIAWRYGWEPDGQKSITEMEYDAAKDRLMFLIDPKLKVDPQEDFDPGPERLVPVRWLQGTSSCHPSCPSMHKRGFRWVRFLVQIMFGGISVSFVGQICNVQLGICFKDQTK